MIVSHRHRYVFVEVPHTGSTAVSLELRENYDGELTLRKHSTYRDFLRHAPPEMHDYFAFAAVRNPLDLAVSRYFRMKNDARGRLGDPEFVARHGSLPQRLEERIQRWVERTGADFERFLLRWYLLPYDSWTSLDHGRLSTVLRFETLADDFASALRQIGVEPVRPLPVANATPGREPEFLAYYTPPARKRATWVFGPYMHDWGYGFPPQWGEVRTPRWANLLRAAIRPFRTFYWKFLRFRDWRNPTRVSRSPFYQQVGEKVSAGIRDPRDNG